MRYYRTILIIVALPCLVSMALADNIPDPRIVIGGDGGSIGVDKMFIFASNANGGGFYGDSNMDKGPIGTPTPGIGLWNASDSDWTQLGIWVPIPYYQGSPITDSSQYVFDNSPFFDQVITSLDLYLTGGGEVRLPNPYYRNPDLGWMLILFSATPDSDYPGIGAGVHFRIELNDDSTNTDPNGTGGWLGPGGQGSALNFYAAGSPSEEWLAAPSVPEPGTLILLLGGLGLIGIRWIRGKRVSKQG